jgi:hypothetical protein
MNQLRFGSRLGCARGTSPSPDSLRLHSPQPLCKGTTAPFHGQLRESAVTRYLRPRNATEAALTPARGRIVRGLRAVRPSESPSACFDIVHGAPGLQSLKHRWLRKRAIGGPAVSNSGLELVCSVANLQGPGTYCLALSSVSEGFPSSLAYPLGVGNRHCLRRHSAGTCRPSSQFLHDKSGTTATGHCRRPSATFRGRACRLPRETAARSCRAMQRCRSSRDTPGNRLIRARDHSSVDSPRVRRPVRSSSPTTWPRTRWLR